MVGTVTIKDSSTKKYVFPNVKSVQHTYEVMMVQNNPSGSTEPAIDNEKVVVHTIVVEFELTDKGTYSGGSDPGTTGPIWKQKSLLTGLKSQPSVNEYYTLFEDDDTIETSGWNGVVQKIITSRLQESQSKITGNLLFTETSDVYNL